MSTDLTISEGKLPLVMKSGVVHWITPDLHARLQTQLGSQSGHSFMKLTELNATINSAEIEGVYTLEQYADYGKVKQGMWQCEYRKWHEKKHVCECKHEWHEKHNQELEAIRRREENRPPTPEERAKVQEIIARMRATSTFTKGRSTGPFLKRSALNEYKRKFGAEYKVPEGTKVEEDVGVLQT